MTREGSTLGDQRLTALFSRTRRVPTSRPECCCVRKRRSCAWRISGTGPPTGSGPAFVWARYPMSRFGILCPESRVVSDRQGLGFELLVADYERGRNGWPPGVCDGVQAETVLDLAAGTGKLTALLVNRFPKVIAVEPSSLMRAVLVEKIPDARAVAGTAEAIPLDDGSVDAVFVAEAFHWFDSVAAGREIGRVLRRDGQLIVSFNWWRGGFDPGLSPAAQAVLDDVMACLSPPGIEKVESGAWRQGLTSFEPFMETAIEHEWITDTPGLASYYVSISSMGALGEERRTELRDRLVALTPTGLHRLPLTARVYRGRQTHRQ
jgi:SAM-dependent methyltransferase